MDRLLVLAVVLAVVVAGYRVAAARCRRNPGHRRWVIIAAGCALAGSVLLVPWLLAKLNPPFSESPAGIFIYLGKAIVVGVMALGGIGALIGALATRPSDPRPNEES